MLIIHITAAYSNAVLVAILPHISNFAKQFDLPISEPIVASQVIHCNISPTKEDVGGSVWLTNHYQFVFGNGYLRAYQSPTNWFNNNYDNWDDTEYFKRYAGKENMTTNEAIEFARASFYKLGYKRKDFDIKRPPTIFDGPENLKRMNLHLPYCRIEWDSPDSRIQSLLGLDYNIQFDVNMQLKQIVGMNLSGRKFFRPNPKIEVVPELETDYKGAGVAGRFAQLFNREPVIHMTPAYSNATLKATLPYVSDFAQKIDLPIARPVTANQVVFSIPPLYKHPHAKWYFQERLMLTNHYWFSFEAGSICEFGTPDNWFEEKETRNDWPLYDSKDCLTTNEAIEMARSSFHRLDFPLEESHVDAAPTTFENAVDRANRSYAYCQIDWDSPEGEPGDDYHIEFDINMRQKQIVGMLLSSTGTNFCRPDPKIDVEPELESDYRKRMNGKMFFRSNAPTYFPRTNSFQSNAGNIPKTINPPTVQTNSPSP